MKASPVVNLVICGVDATAGDVFTRAVYHVTGAHIICRVSMTYDTDATRLDYNYCNSHVCSRHSQFGESTSRGCGVDATWC